jgi:hypothetical protein
MVIFKLCEIKKHVKFFQRLIKIMNILIQGKMKEHILSKEEILIVIDLTRSS